MYTSSKISENISNKIYNSISIGIPTKLKLNLNYFKFKLNKGKYFHIYTTYYIEKMQFILQYSYMMYTRI